MSDELKPCPLCGCEVHLTEFRMAAWSSPSYSIACEKCEPFITCNDKKAQAIKAWNTRDGVAQ